MSARCKFCDDPAQHIFRDRPICRECLDELVCGLVPPLEQVTSPHIPHVPLGVSIYRHGRQAGTGEGNDYFGNHT